MRSPPALFAVLGLTCACGGAPAPPSSGLGGMMGEQASGTAPVSAASARPAGPVATGERAKIVRLIELVRTSDIVLVRNGRAHDAGSAADHLAAKLERVDDPTMTAREFIQRRASFSSQSSEPYLVRLPDGKTMTANEWLLARLAEIEAAQRDAVTSR